MMQSSSTSGDTQSVQPIQQSSLMILVVLAVCMTIIGINDLTPISINMWLGLPSFLDPANCECDFAITLASPLYVGLLACIALWQRLHIRMIVEMMFWFATVQALVALGVFLTVAAPQIDTFLYDSFLMLIIQWSIVSGLTWWVRRDTRINSTPARVSQMTSRANLQSDSTKRRGLLPIEQQVSYLLIGGLLCMGMISVGMFLFEQYQRSPYVETSGEAWAMSFGCLCAIDAMIASSRLFVGYMGIRSIQKPDQAHVLVGLIIVFAAIHVVGLGMSGGYAYVSDLIRMQYQLEFIMYTIIAGGYMWLWRRVYHMS
jgi:hypothetical protein